METRHLKEMVLFIIEMVINIKVWLKIDSDMVKVFLSGQMVVHMKVNGKTINNMDLVNQSTLLLMRSLKETSLIMSKKALEELLLRNTF